MRCSDLHLISVRNHRDTPISDLAPKWNLLIGPNGAGKTSIIEALSIVCLTKSFTGAADAVLLTTGAPHFSVDARFISDNDVPLHSTVEWSLGPPVRKTITLNSDKLRRSSDLIGRIPIVALTPDDKIITSGSPEERRRFLSIVLSQSSSLYLEDEMELKKALKHRNSLLLDCKHRGMSLASAMPLLEPWTNMVAERSVRLMLKRYEFVALLRPMLEEAYRELSDSKEKPSLQYLPMGLAVNDDFRTMLDREFARVSLEELCRGITLVGAHRDELILYIDDGREARRFASQGQHKTLLISLKLAEFQYLKNATGETPILLLDDVFSELDAERSNKLSNIIARGEYGQVFITSTTRESLKDFALTDSGIAYIISDGMITRS